MIDGILYVGNNTGTAANGIYDRSKVKENLIIPKTVRGKPIKKIGQCAFRCLTEIKNVYIFAEIDEICNYGFDMCSNIENINIPATVTKIGANALCLSGDSSSNTVTIKFDKSSKINSLLDGAIAAKANVIILYCGTKSVSNCGGNIFLGAANKVVYSASSQLSFCGVSTTKVEEAAICLPAFPYKEPMRCSCLYHKSSNYLIVIIIIITK